MVVARINVNSFLSQRQHIGIISLARLTKFYGISFCQVW